MSDNKEKSTRQEAPKTIEGAIPAESTSTRVREVQNSGWKRWMGKKWVFPATYMAAAAIILALMWVIQDSGKTDVQDQIGLDQLGLEQLTENLPDAVPVGALTESLQWPVNRDEVKVNRPFYDSTASNADKQEAIIVQGNKFMPNMGVSLAREDDQSFDVLAAMSGKVTRSEHVPSVGNLVEITHDEGLVTIYYSLADVSVVKGDLVELGDVIARAGRNELEKELGVHLHFEVLKGGDPVNPESAIATLASPQPQAENQTEAGDQSSRAVTE
jgi:stage II sporulation protein Q